VKAHLVGVKVNVHPEFVPDDNVWLVRGVCEQGKRAYPDNEFFVRLVPCPDHETGPETYSTGLFFVSSLPYHLLKKAMDIGIEILGKNGFIEADDEDDDDDESE
jgi:hypothetical protein